LWYTNKKRSFLLGHQRGRERVASDSLFWNRKLLVQWWYANKNFEEILVRAPAQAVPFFMCKRQRRNEDSYTVFSVKVKEKEKEKRKIRGRKK
jgi:hypothetical protein